MRFNVALFNARDVFSDPDRSEKLALELVYTADPGIIVVNEAYAVPPEGDADISPALDRFAREGFQSVHAPYDDEDHRADAHGMVVASTVPFESEVLRLGSRNAIRLAFLDVHGTNRLNVFAAHLDDRSEDTRRDQAHHLVDEIDPDIPTILALQANSMPAESARARSMRALEPLVRTMFGRAGHIDPGVYAAMSRGDKLKNSYSRLGSLALRTAAMADGGALQKFLNAGLRFTDEKHHTTIRRYGLFDAELDFILVNRHVTRAVSRESILMNGFDHRVVRADVEVPNGQSTDL